MSNARFSEAEMAYFQDRFPAVAAWGRWIRHEGPAGRDVIELFVDGRRPVCMRLVKTEDGRYAASGFDGWSLTVCDEFETMLDVVGRMLPGEDQGRLSVQRKRSAA